MPGTTTLILRNGQMKKVRRDDILREEPLDDDPSLMRVHLRSGEILLVRRLPEIVGVAHLR